ncbi:hypothetical protein WDU94_006725 [Cyamophila willieti]
MNFLNKWNLRQSNITRLMQRTINLFKCSNQGTSSLKKSQEYGLHYSFLWLLHWMGLIHLPHNSHSHLFNKIHQIYSWLVLSVLIETSFLLLISIFFKSIQDPKEFILRIIEVLVMVVFTYEIFQTKVHIHEVLGMIRYMEEHFLTIPANVKKKYQREQWITIIVLAISLVSLFILLIHETFVPFPQADLDLIRKLYNKKHPERTLPIIFWMPVVDSSEPIPYKIFYVFITIVLILCLTSVAYCMLNITLFLTPLQGQFEVLAECLEQLGGYPRDPLGTYIWTSDDILAIDKSLDWESSVAKWLRAQSDPEVVGSNPG